MLLVADAVLDAMGDDIDAIGGLAAGADPIAFGVAAVAAVRGRPLRALVAEPRMIPAVVDRGGTCAAAAAAAGLEFRALVTALELGFTYESPEEA